MATREVNFGFYEFHFEEILEEILRFVMIILGVGVTNGLFW
jgi:hypothetical protein